MTIKRIFQLAYGTAAAAVLVEIVLALYQEVVGIVLVIAAMLMTYAKQIQKK